MYIQVVSSNQLILTTSQNKINHQNNLKFKSLNLSNQIQTQYNANFAVFPPTHFLYCLIILIFSSNFLTQKPVVMQRIISFFFYIFSSFPQFSQVFNDNLIIIFIQYETMASLSATKQQLLQQMNQSRNAKVHPYVRSMLDKVHNEAYSLTQKFKNLEDPLKFIHNQSIQNLVDKTEESAFKLKKQMEDVSEFSKSMFKKIIAREGNEFDFQNIKQEGKALQKSQIKDTELIKAQSMCRLRENRNTESRFKKEVSVKQLQNMQVFQPFQPLIFYKHQIEDVRQNKGQSNKNAKIDLNYGHIKMMDSQKFDDQCKNVEFYQTLTSLRTDKYHMYNQDYDIEKSSSVNKLCDKIPLQLITDDCEYSSFSQVLFFDFDSSLKFWKQGNNQMVKKGIEVDEQFEKPTDETTVALFEQFRKKEINVNNLCDLAMGKITVDQLRYYLKLKQQQKTKLRGRSEQNMQDDYFQLLKEFNKQNQIKTRIKSQRIPVKYLDSESQTIKNMDQTDFDDYFNLNFKQLFNRISKLSEIRQNAMTNKKIKNRIVVIKNSCQDIADCLFKLLTLILKGEKFYPREKANEQYYAPFFTYRQLFDVESRDQVERKILELIYSKINEFKCEFVDGIAKSELISLYVQQRQKNNRILDIASTQ